MLEELEGAFFDGRWAAVRRLWRGRRIACLVAVERGRSVS